MAEARGIRVLISGRVQGVGYRAWAQRRAAALGLSGWVRNRADGKVEAVFSGSAEALESMLAECRKGPPHAAVRDVELFSDVPDRDLSAFTILPDS